MNYIDWTGFIGVTLLLLAFFLNLMDKIKTDSLTYLLLNFLGAGIACLASVLLNYMPFVILEGCWALVSAVGLVKLVTKNKVSS
ncbi:MAG: CBU_0592 family membrane protein [Lutibacter sp.]